MGRWRKVAEQAGVSLPAGEGRTAKDAIDGLLELSRSEESRARQLACRNRAQQRLGMPVDPVIRPAEVWREAADPLVQQIQSGPFVAVLIPDEGDQKSAVTGRRDGA